MTGRRGGIHNSVTRVCPKPTHMIGGYAQLAYGFNYYGTVGSNRDEFIMIRKMKNIDWLDGEGRDRTGGEEMKIRSQVGMVLNLDKCIGCHTCSVTCKTSGAAAKGWNMHGSTTWKPSRYRLPQNWEDQDEWQGGWIRGISGKLTPRGNRVSVLSKIFANPVLPQIDDYYEPFTYDYQHLHNAPEGKYLPTARPRSLISGERMDKITGAKLGGTARRRV